jgi:hypothetical protein
MSEKPKRPWFRFHLLTAVILMFAAAVFLFWFVSPVSYFHNEFAKISTLGWPVTLAVWGDYWISNPNSVRGALRCGDAFIFWYGVIIDFTIMIAALTLVAIYSESIIRRREARKT